MKKMILAVVAVAAIVVAASCGGGSNGSCTINSVGYSFCEEFLGSSYTSDSAKTACGSNTFSTDSCPTAGSLGTCDNATVASAEYKYTYYVATGDTGGVTFTADNAKTSCTAGGGTFTAP